MKEEQPDIIIAIMKQLSFKVGLKEWGEKLHNNAHSDMKKLNFRDTLKQKHWKELDNNYRETVL